MKSSAFLLAAALAAVAALTAPASAQVYVRYGPPPAPLVERVPVAPGPEFVWRGGHWQWNGHRYVWIGGHFVRRPYARAGWHPGHYVRTPHGWEWREGHWG